MSWIGISTGRRVLRAPARSDPNEIITVGTVVLELPFQPKVGQTQTVFDLNPTLEWPRRIHMTLSAEGVVAVESRLGSAVRNTSVAIAKPDPDAELRITLSWHAPERLGLLTVENLDTKELVQKMFEHPLPWTQCDVFTLIEPNNDCYIDHSLGLIAVSDQIEPVGLSGGFGAGTMVDTDAGPVAVEDLRPGDIVQTSEHGMQPIRRITSYEVPSAGRFAPIELTAPFFGLDRDLIVARDHRLLVEGADAEYLFGTDEVLIAAHYLKRMAAPLMPTRPATVRYVQVLLDAHVCLSVGGAWGESLYVGDLRDNPARLATSTLAHVLPKDLPRHAAIAGPQLKGYEAIVLVSALCA